MSAAAYGAVFAAAALLSIVLIPPVRAVALRLGAVDRGGGRRAHEGEVPRLGGLGIYLAWAAVTAAGLAASEAWALDRRIVGAAGGSLLLLAVGAYDDVRGASVRLKLAAQMAAAALVVGCGLRIEVLTNPVGESFRAGWMALPLTVAWLVAVTNAYNLIDGADGLAATTGITICVGMALLFTGAGQGGRLAIVALAGALAGFLRQNFPPARIFMGDCGSQSVGLLLGAFSLLSFAKASTLAALVLPLAVFGHPLVDLAYAVLRRYHRGQSIGGPDREHLHHLLLDRGYSRRGTLAILAVLNLSLVAAVVYLSSRRLPGAVVLLALGTVPAGVALRLARHIAAGGSVREEALAFFMNRERRRVLHQARVFRRAAPAAADAATLAEQIREFVRETRVGGVRIMLLSPGGPRTLLFSDGTPARGGRVTVSVSVVRPGREFALLEVGVNRDEEGRKSLSDAAGALADGVRAHLEGRHGDAGARVDTLVDPAV